MPVMVYNSDGTPQLDGNGKPIYEMQRLVKRSWDYDELVLDIENVVYILLTRGRFGSTFKGLTQTINVNESRMGGEPAQQKEKKWGIF
jgi:hypothetical protein